MGEIGQAFSSGCRSLDRSDRLDDLWTAGIYAASIGDRFRSFNLLEQQTTGSLDRKGKIMNTKMALIAIFVSAVITFGLRALPFLVFQEGKELPDQIKRLGMVLPSSIMAVLIVYCLKDVGDDFMADGLWKLIAAAITAVSYKWKHNTLISILLGTVSYMLFLHFFG